MEEAVDPLPGHQSADILATTSASSSASPSYCSAPPPASAARPWRRPGAGVADGALYATAGGRQPFLSFALFDGELLSISGMSSTGSRCSCCSGGLPDHPGSAHGVAISLAL